MDKLTVVIVSVFVLLPEFLAGVIEFESNVALSKYSGVMHCLPSGMYHAANDQSRTEEGQVRMEQLPRCGEELGATEFTAG